MSEVIPPPKKLVLWIIWFALTSSIVVYQFILGHGVPQGTNEPTTAIHPMALVAVATIAMASLVRWLLIPRNREAGKLLVLMIVGLALSESAQLFGLFLIPSGQPETKLAIWILALLSALQFMPVYANERPPSDAFRQG
jgi:hypothetical protein